MFSISFPLGPLFSYINNLIEIRIDAFKVLTQYKRSLPKKAENIGLNFIQKIVKNIILCLYFMFLKAFGCQFWKQCPYLALLPM